MQRWKRADCQVCSFVENPKKISVFFDFVLCFSFEGAQQFDWWCMVGRTSVERQQRRQERLVWSLVADGSQGGGPRKLAFVFLRSTPYHLRALFVKKLDLPDRSRSLVSLRDVGATETARVHAFISYASLSSSNFRLGSPSQQLLAAAAHAPVKLAAAHPKHNALPAGISSLFAVLLVRGIKQRIRRRASEGRCRERPRTDEIALGARYLESRSLMLRVHGVRAGTQRELKNTKIRSVSILPSHTCQSTFLVGENTIRIVILSPLESKEPSLNSS